MAKEAKTEKRRASLVMLVTAVAKSDDERLHQLAYKNIEVLKDEKDIFITKAISWLLRAMADIHPDAARAYIELRLGLS
jgi:3-methyladenine DNA glycosylase AlkD